MSVETIVAELHRLRETQSEREVMSATAATSSLIVYCDDAQAWDGITDSARQIAIAHGARLLLLDATGLNHGEHVCAFCSREGTDTICCEQVTLPLVTRDHAMILADVEDLLLPGLPAYLWWSCRRLDDGLFPRLRALAKRVVVDTSLDGNGHGLLELERALSREPHAGLRDLAWLRGASWREMAARFFDDPRRVDELERLEKIELQSGTPAEAALLAAWIGVQLGYTATRKSRQLTTPTGRQVTFTYTRRGKPGEICALFLRVGRVTYSAVAESDGHVVNLCRESPDEHRGRCEPMIRSSLEMSVSEALYGPGGDGGFTPALGLAACLVDS